MKSIMILFYPTLIAFLLYFLVTRTSIKQTVKENWKFIIGFSCVSSFVLILFVFYRMRLENFIPYRDYAGFYRSTLELIKAFENKSAHEFFVMIYESMLYSEYSYFAELFLVLPLMLIGNTYSKFILSMIVCFVIPLTVLIYTIGLHYELISKGNKMQNGVCALVVILFAMNLMPTIYGYVGSAGLFFIAVIFYLSYEEINSSEFHFDVNALIGLLLLLIVLIRRWFAYTVVAYFVVEGIYHLLVFINKRDKNRFVTAYMKLFVQGCSALIPMLMFFMPLVRTFTTTDYAVAFSAAIKGTPMQQVYALINNYSPVVFVVSLFSLVSRRYRSVACKLIINMMIVFVMFTQVQDFGSHHYYMTNVQMMILLLMGLDTLLSYSKRARIVCSMIFVLLYGLNFYSMSISKVSFPASQFLISTIHVPIRVTQEREKIEMLSHFLGNEPRDYEYAYVLSASPVLNDDLLRNALLPDIINATPWLEGTRVWDQRDGIPSKFFQYTYIVVTDPIQYNAAPEDQRVIGLLAEGMLNDEELRSYYRLEWEFDYLDMKVYVYKRIEDIDISIIDRYSNLFKQFYPEQPKLYEFES